MGRGWKRILQDVPALRTDGQGPHGGPQGEPLQHQDQAPVPAEPVQRHLHLGRARPQRAPARLDQRHQVGRPPRRLRRLHDQGQGPRAVAEGTVAEEGDREEDRGKRAGSCGELRFSAKPGRFESFERPGRKTRLFRLGRVQGRKSPQPVMAGPSRGAAGPEAKNAKTTPCTVSKYLRSHHFCRA
jgi:hypothetical protein